MVRGECGAPRSRMAAFQWSSRSEMSSLTRASRPMLRIFCVVLMLVRGLLATQRVPPRSHTRDCCSAQSFTAIQQAHSKAQKDHCEVDTGFSASSCMA